MKTALNDMQLPEIWETEEDKKLSIKQLKARYTKYAYTHFVKNPPLVILNQSTMWNIEVTTRVIKEWWNKSRTRPRIISIQLLDKMIKTAILIQTGKDEKILRVLKVSANLRIVAELTVIHIKYAL